MNREIKNEINENPLKEPQMEEDKNISNFYSNNEKGPIDPQMNSNIINLQNSACKNFKNEMKPESANIYM